MKWTQKFTQDHENPMANDRPHAASMTLEATCWSSKYWLKCSIIQTAVFTLAGVLQGPCHLWPVAVPPPLPTGVHGASTMVGQPGQLGTGALAGGVATGGHHGGSAAVCHSCGGGWSHPKSQSKRSLDSLAVRGAAHWLDFCRLARDSNDNG